MAIKTTQHCDRCHSEIPEDSARPGFPQISWCFFRKGLRLLKRVSGEPVLSEDWQGMVNRLEFCQEHGQQFNALLKAFVSGEPALAECLDLLFEEDGAAWNAKQEAVEAEYKSAVEAFDADQKARAP